ncbi:MAG: hypothetical protein WBK95_01885 [Sulfurimonas sp.]|nr:hypothetical protein [Sulfurimonas sp.]MDD3060913.1 hypothetical protein [Sulfurimonas sp.]MDD5202903.1 hypothetical protein [Sulfurimonas sp.]
MYDLSKLAAVARAMNGFECDCAITVALKISDDSCKMDEYEKSVFMALFDAMPDKQTDFFDENIFEIISHARAHPSASSYAKIKILRENAMLMITQENMKKFKADIRTRLL